MRGAIDVIMGGGEMKEEDVTATLVQTVGPKSYDGFMLAIVE